MIRLLTATALILAAALFVACGGDDDDATDAPTSPAAIVTTAGATAATTPSPTETEKTPEETDPVESTVEVTMLDDAIELDVDTVPTGEITFNIANNGTKQHTFGIVETTLDEGALPTTATGDYMNGDDATLLANTPGTAAGETTTLTYALTTGIYVLISIDDGDYGNGMFQEFTVE